MGAAATKDGNEDKKTDPADEQTGLVKKQDEGEPFKYDPSFNGPIKKRSCTDVVCFAVFLVFLAGLAAVSAIDLALILYAAYFSLYSSLASLLWLSLIIISNLYTVLHAFTRGDPKTLLFPTDSDGVPCGIGKFENKPNLFFFDLMVCGRMGLGVVINGCPTPQVCVEKCPSTYWTYLQDVPTNNRDNLICRNNIDLNSPEYAKMSIYDLVSKDVCAPYYVESKPLVGRCVPSAITKLLDKSKQLVTQVGNTNFSLKAADNKTVTGSDIEKGSKYLAIMMSTLDIAKAILADMEVSWWMMLIGLVVAAIFALLWILIMRWIAGVMVWLSLALFIGLFGFGTYYGFSKYVELKDSAASDGNIEFKLNLKYYLARKETWLAIGIIAAIFLGLILLIVLILRNRIRIAIAIIKETSKAIGHMMLSLLWPLFPFILQLGVFGFWGAVTLYLASSGRAQKIMNTLDNSSTAGNPVYDSIDCSNLQPNSTTKSLCHFVKYGGDEYTIYLQIYNLFMLFWLMNFVIALGQMTLAGAFASFYWAFNKPKDIPAFPLAASFWRCFRFHLGTLAFGSLLIAIVQLIRAMLEYLDNKLKASENPVAKFFLKCLKCFFWCLEKVLKFLTKNAYIMCAVYGKNFCTSAKNAFFLILRNAVRVVVIDKVTDFVIFIAKLVVVGAVTTAAFFFFDGRIPFMSNYKPELQYNFIPVIVIAIGSYVIAACFFSVYNMGVDTLFLCFLEDLERHDGTAEKPYYMSKELMSILGKKNVKPKKDKKADEAEKKDDKAEKKDDENNENK